jgi:hypothetical protein
MLQFAHGATQAVLAARRISIFVFQPTHDLPRADGPSRPVGVDRAGADVAAFLQALAGKLLGFDLRPKRLRISDIDDARVVMPAKRDVPDVGIRAHGELKDNILKQTSAAQRRGARADKITT